MSVKMRLVKRSPKRSSVFCDAADVGEVRADADDQAAASPLAGRALAASISARIRRMAASRPVKIASPIRKWPMLSSASSGMAATGVTVS